MIKAYAIDHSLLLCVALLMMAPDADAAVRRVCTWAVLGPFIPARGDGFDEDFLSGEAGVMPAIGASLAGKTWSYYDDRLYCRNHDDYNDLFTCFMDDRPGNPGGGTENRVAYCGAYVWSPSVQSIALRYGANDKAKIWLNGEMIHQQSTASEGWRERNIIDVSLKMGWNRVLLKVVNIRRIWGFYLALTDRAGNRLSGLEYTPTNPSVGEPLAILTPALPVGFRTQPYVWLEVKNPEGIFADNNPSASPFRFCGTGGIPPYEWQIDGLPPGLTFDRAEGEMEGCVTDTGAYSVTVTMHDSAPTPRSAKATLTLRIKPRVTEEWWEKGYRLCGLRHHLPPGKGWNLDHISEQVELLSRMGYSWAGYSVLSQKTVDYDLTPPTVTIHDSPATQAWRDAIRAAGVRFGQHFSIKDNRDEAPDFKAHNESIHDALQQFMRANNTEIWWFDEMYGPFWPPDYYNFEFDALFSLLKTMNPGTLIIVNGDERARDYICGDLDIVEVHGEFCTGTPGVYWGYWPSGPLDNNPKHLPVDSWKYPCGQLDADEWCRAIVTMLAEPENNTRMRMFNFDATPQFDPDTIALMRQLADWLEPRKQSILATQPYTITEGAWGYDVTDPATGDVYLHLIANSRGKTGWSGGNLTIEPVAFTVSAVTTVPMAESVQFTQSDTTVQIDMSGVMPDPVSTILRLTPAPESPRPSGAMPKDTTKTLNNETHSSSCGD